MSPVTPIKPYFNDCFCDLVVRSRKFLSDPEFIGNVRCDLTVEYLKNLDRTPSWFNLRSPYKVKSHTIKCGDSKFHSTNIASVKSTISKIENFKSLFHPVPKKT